MNENHHHDPDISARIERLLSSGAASGSAAADQLAQTRPQANPDFQRSLEDRLLAQLRTNPHEGEQNMTALTPPLNRITSNKSVSYIPITLAAAMLVVVLMGSILLMSSGKSPDSNTVLMLQTSPTSIPQSYINVVVVYQDLPRGYQFPSNLEDLDGIVGYAPIPEAVLPVDTLRESENGLEKVLGQLLKSDVNRYRPMTASLLAQDVTQLSTTPNTPMQAPPGRVSTSLSMSLTELLNSGIHQGDWVDVVASMLYTDAGETYQTVQPPAGISTSLNPQNTDCSNDTPCSVTQTFIDDALLLNIGSPTNEGATIMVTLAVQPDQLPIVTWMLQAKLPYILRPVIPEIPQLPTYPGQIPFHMWLSEIDYNWIVSDLSQIQAGDVVDVTFSFLLQAPEPEQSNTLEPENGWVFNRVILSGVKLYKLGESIGSSKQVVTLLLEPEDGVLLSILLDTLTPIAVTVNKAGAAAPDFQIESLADGRASVTLPIEAVINGDQTWQEGTNVVDVIADMTFSITHTDPTTSELNQRQVSQILIEDAEFVTNMGGGAPGGDGVMTATITIPQDDLAKLQWAVNSRIPLTLQLSNN